MLARPNRHELPIPRPRSRGETLTTAPSRRPTVEDAAQQLRHDGFQVARTRRGGDDGACSRAASRKNDLIYITSQLAIMVDTGITLSTALAGIVEQEANPTLRKRARTT